MNITNSTYSDLKHHYNVVLNTDKTTYKTSNDEPTPIECIEEMLEKIPAHFWKKNNLKILDPCCGNGNFHLVCFEKLKASHDTKYILEEILHFNDINVDRIENVKKVFCETDYKLNITMTNYLEQSYDDKFDAIIANPPYAKILDNGKRASKNHNLIRDFLDKSLKILKPGGYLVFITPDNWMSFADRNEIVKKLTKLQILHLNIHTAKKYFSKIGSSFTWYIVENTQHYTDICVEGIYKNKMYTSYVPSGMREYIPLFYNNDVYSILSKTIDNKELTRFKVETTSDLHKYTKRDLISDKEDEEHPYRLIHTPKQTVWASRPHKYQEGYKVFISTTDRYKVFVDCCGMTQSIAFIRCKSQEEAEITKVVLMHPLYNFINNICRWGNFNNIRILQRFPVPYNQDDIFGSFNITEKEQEMINTYL